MIRRENPSPKRRSFAQMSMKPIPEVNSKSVGYFDIANEVDKLLFHSEPARNGKP